MIDSSGIGANEEVPIKLQLRVLQFELERLDEDLRRLSERRSQVEADIARYEEYLSRTHRRGILRRVK